MKSHIPKFKSLKEEREFWQTHSVTEFWDELKPAKLEFVQPRKKTVSVKLAGFEVRILQDVLARLVGSRPRPYTPTHRK